VLLLLEVLRLMDQLLPPPPPPPPELELELLLLEVELLPVQVLVLELVLVLVLELELVLLVVVQLLPPPPPPELELVVLLLVVVLDELIMWLELELGPELLLQLENPSLNQKLQPLYGLSFLQQLLISDFRHGTR
jgi:hypothetical protein